VNKKPPELPNIEDATLRACLAPLMEAMNAGSEQASQASAQVAAAPPTRLQAASSGSPARLQAAPLGSPAPLEPESSGSNDNPLPVAARLRPVDVEPFCTPKTLAEWRLQADDEFAAFRMVELFLGMTDAELVAAVAEFPRQITGTVARIGRIKQRLAAQYDKVTAAVALLERARLQAAADAEPD
jgi:hypothetical protein